MALKPEEQQELDDLERRYGTSVFDEPKPKPTMLQQFGTATVEALPEIGGLVGGAFGTLEEADSWAEHLIRTVDSLHEIHIGYVGREFPLTLDPIYFSETHEVNLKKKRCKGSVIYFTIQLEQSYLQSD
jgi:hypothetical protein